MRISDWSSDVCSSDLQPGAALPRRHIGFGDRVARLRQPDSVVGDDDADDIAGAYIELRVDRARTVMIGFFRLFFDSLDGILDNVRRRLAPAAAVADPRYRPSGVSGKRVSGRVDLGGPRTHK